MFRSKQSIKWAIRPTGRRAKHTPGVMNGAEAAYAARLHVLVLAGEVLQWWFEAVTLKLADDCRLTPDFLVMLANGRLEFHEVKGRWEEDAKIKARLAALHFPFPIKVFRRQPKRAGGGFELIDEY